MTCDNCNPGTIYPGKFIKTTPDFSNCAVCGAPIRIQRMSSVHKHNYDSSSWDTYFHSICVAVASKSPCLSRKIGAILVRDHSIVSTGYNGPPRGIPHCGFDRIMKDYALTEVIRSWPKQHLINHDRFANECPRKVLGCASGTHMELCPAQHAEENCISNAARLGVSTIGTTLYMNCVIPCKNCFGTLINAGIVEIVVDDTKPYDVHTQFLIDNSTIKIRRFEL